MRSHAAVWSCHVLVLRLLWSSTGVTIIMPKVLIIYRETERQEKTEREKDWESDVIHCHSCWKSLIQLFSKLFLYCCPRYPETFVSIFLLSVNGIGLPQKISESVSHWTAASLGEPDELRSFHRLTERASFSPTTVPSYKSQCSYTHCFHSCDEVHGFLVDRLLQKTKSLPIKDETNGCEVKKSKKWDSECQIFTLYRSAMSQNPFSLWLSF